MVLIKQRCLLRGYVFFQIGGHEKAVCEKYWDLNLKKTRNYWVATLNEVSLLVYDNTAVLRGCHTISDYEYGGGVLYCRGTFGNL